MIFIGMVANTRGEAEAPATFAVTLACITLLGLISWRPDWFFHASQPWLAWLETGGLGLLALAGSIGWLCESGKMRLLLAVAGFAWAGWLFHHTPRDEFGHVLSLQIRIAYLVPALVLLLFHVWVFIVLHRRPGDGGQRTGKATLASVLCLVQAMLGAIVFVRANYLESQSGVVRAVLCLDAQSGQVLWSTPVFVATAEKRHSLNSLATPTPACDGERVYAYFGSGLAALDKSGQLLWLKRDPEFAGFIRYGAGSSVVLAGDRIVIYRDSEFMGHGDGFLDDDIQDQKARRPSALSAIDKVTGAEVWSVTPPFSHDSYMTPLVWTQGGQLEVVIVTWKTLAGFAVSDGSLRWTHSHPMQQIVPSLAVNGQCLIVTGGHITPCPIVAVRAPSSAAPAQTLWFNRATGGNIVSPVCWDGLVFSMSHIGILTGRDAESGHIHWTKRLGSQYLALALVAGDGKLYALDQNGTLNVLAADKTGSELATHSLHESCSATPAIAAGVLIVRTSGHVYCIGSGE